jgi:hypothetical protein
VLAADGSLVVRAASKLFALNLFTAVQRRDSNYCVSTCIMKKAGSIGLETAFSITEADTYCTTKRFVVTVSPVFTLKR